MNEKIKFVVNMREFKAVLQMVRVAASKNLDLPALTKIALKVHNGYVYLWATDRFKLMAGRVKITPNGADKTVEGENNIGLDELRYLSMMPSHKESELTVSFEDDHKVTFTSDRESVSCVSFSENYPEVLGLFDAPLSSEQEVFEQGLNPVYLAEVSAAMGKASKALTGDNHPIMIRPGKASKPVLLYMAGCADLISLIMPSQAPTDQAFKAVKEAFTFAGGESK